MQSQVYEDVETMEEKVQEEGLLGL